MNFNLMVNVYKNAQIDIFLIRIENASYAVQIVRAAQMIDNVCNVILVILWLKKEA